jgi:iron complex outermembrane receptor protein
MRGKHGLFLSTALVALCADPILAQSQQAQSSGNDQIEEIVVTSEKRPEKLSQTTVTATVVSAEAIQKNQVNDITDLNKLVPAVNLAGTFNGRVPLAIRGVESDSNEAAVGISSGVGIEVDGIPVPSDSFAANDVEDISDIEVLEGPQATLGGRTATSGIINYITHKPTGIWTGSADATFTDDGERHVQANISGPVTDKVLISLFGWGHTTVFPVDNVVLDRNSYADSYGFRDKVTFQPTDDFDATLMTRLSATKSYGGNFVYTYIYPTTHLLLGPTPFAPPFLSPSALISPGIAVNQSNTEYGSPVTAAAESHYDADISLNLNYHIGDYTLNSVTSYQHETRKSVQDLFAVDAYYFTELTGGHLPYNNTQTEWVNVGQTTEEVTRSITSSGCSIRTPRPS